MEGNKMDSLNTSIINIRVELQNAKLKKSGKNKFAGFDYFELADFLPKLNELMLKEKINDRFSIINNSDGTMTASLLLIKGDEQQEYTMPFVLFATPLNKSGQPSMQDIQYLGALNTYYKRYLYLNAFGITDGEVIDSMNNNDLSKKSEPDYRKELIKYCKENNIDMNKVAKDYQLAGRKLSNDDYYDVLCEVRTGLEPEKNNG